MVLRFMQALGFSVPRAEVESEQEFRRSLRELSGVRLKTAQVSQSRDRAIASSRSKVKELERVEESARQPLPSDPDSDPEAK